MKPLLETKVVAAVVTARVDCVSNNKENQYPTLTMNETMAMMAVQKHAGTS